MSEGFLAEPYENYAGEAHPIYLGKNRRLADPVFFPAPGAAAPFIGDARLLMAHEVDEHPDGGLHVVQDVMHAWGAGNIYRFPPGGPAPSLNDYEKAMRAMAAEVYQTWHKIQALVRNHEDDIQTWVIEAYPRADADVEISPLHKLLRGSWLPTVRDFNNCHPDIRMFMENKDIESDFQIDAPLYNSPRKFPFSFINQFFSRVREVDREMEGPSRDHYAALFRPPYNFNDNRAPAGWPHRTEPMFGVDNGVGYNHPDSRAWFRRNRVMFLVPDLVSSELQNPVRLLSFIHARGRQHPSVFAKIDSDMTYTGRRTTYLTGPLIANRMVSFNHSGPGSASGYQPRLWRGWGGQSQFSSNQVVTDEYADLWHRGQLLGTSEAWIMLQSQRATYLYLWNLLTGIATDLKLDPRTSLTPRPPQEQSEVFALARKRTESLQSRNLNHWLYFTRQQPFVSPPTSIDSRFLRELQNKVEIAEAHVQELFSDPGYFFDRIDELRDHHWGHIGMKNDAKNPDESDEKASFLEHYADEKARHVLYFDLVRGVMRRSIFEFYMWHSIHSRLLEFDNAMKQEFEDYGKKDDADSDGTHMLQQPPVFLSPRKKLKHASVSDKYLALVVMLRYHAVFFVNEFRKKGIHAGSPQMRDIAYSIGQLQKPTTDRICDIAKTHYGAPDLKHQSKLQAPWLQQLSKSGGSHPRYFIFEAIDTFIADPLDSTNAGIKDAAAFLQELTQCPDDQLKELFTELLDDTIDGLDLLSSLADHLEYLWPAMDVVGGADATEVDRRKWFDMGSKDVSINLLDFDAFDFDDKVPMKRLKRLFLFFDELQGFKKESVSVGHAKGDLRRFGASLLRKLVYPLNDAAKASKASREAVSRLKRAMDVTGAEYIYHEQEKPLNLDEEEAGFGVAVSLVDQPQSYRNIAARERQLAKERQEKRDELIQQLLEPSKEEAAKEKKRQRKKARRKDKARRRKLTSGEPVSEEDDDDDGNEEEEMPDVVLRPNAAAAQNESRWQESLHSMLQQFQLPSVPETRTFSVSSGPRAAVPAPSSSSSSSISSKPLPKAPDGRPKRIMKKREWATLEAIYGIHGSANAAVSYAQLRAMMGALGYEEVGRGGSHMSYGRVDGRWPHGALPKGETIQLARTHGRDRAAAAKGKSRDWGRRLCERGLTFEFVKQWFVKG
ncbi:hypothetical protein BBK36DRAFT_1121034 [Trichoderma citrinoviride]|uniref:Uncharacterized protein n=1 Tax=Trichoderma citrinoviride TaxID=58853 RepID=A0A2T4B8J8_9HYPO|nr:hypothetical protein BBK36DRAFT_1121034 [Trichoderma citrinoviride]PTB65654.1 hypothetical protein BBK36DRAFT_1121034 [Trichoderma citrinoviride]